MLAYTSVLRPVTLPSESPTISIVADVVASVRGGEVVLLPALDPLDGTSEVLGDDAGR